MFKLVALLIVIAFIGGNLFNQFLLQKVITWIKGLFRK
jgi:hypothetical protein